MADDTKEPQPLTTDELAHAYGRIRAALVKRLEARKKKSDKSDIYEDSVKTISAAQDLYAYDRLLTMCKSLSVENDEIKALLEMVNGSSVVMVDDLINRGGSKLN